jgi:hypothetical protein
MSRHVGGVMSKLLTLLAFTWQSIDAALLAATAAALLVIPC